MNAAATELLTHGQSPHAAALAQRVSYAEDDVVPALEYIARSTHRNEIPRYVVVRLVNDKAWQVRRAMAAHAKLEPALIDRLVTDIAFAVRAAVAGRTDLSPAQIERLSRDRSWTVRRVLVIFHQDVPFSIGRFAADPDWQVREAVASRTDIGIGILNGLASDENADVRYAATHSLTALMEHGVDVESHQAPTLQ